jgi:orotidine-5'-phosphate decarboxylase
MYCTLLESRYFETKSSLCIGLDPNIEFIKNNLGYTSIFEFNKEIINATNQFALAYKPQIAHYSAFGLEKELENTIKYIKENFPAIPVILDAKRGDIGSTAEMYAHEAYVRYGADAVTVNPYLGLDSIEPFIKYADRGVIVLSKTSNIGSNFIQNSLFNNEPLYLHIVRRFEETFPNINNLQYVVGATYPEELSQVRALIPNKWLLVPGVGAQGGDLRQVMHNGERVKGGGVIINNTRALLYCSQTNNMDEHLVSVRNAAENIFNSIQTNSIHAKKSLNQQ